MPPHVFGQLTIIASHDGRELGPEDGAPVFYDWNPLWSIGRVLPWAVLLCFFALKANRTRRAWAVLVPLALVWGGAFVMAKIASVLSTLLGSGILSAVGVPALTLAAWWLASAWLAGRGRWGLFVRAALIAIVMGFAGVVGLQGFALDASVLVDVIGFGAAAVALLLGLGYAARRCRRRFSATRFVVSFLLALVAIGLTMPCLIFGALALFGLFDSMPASTALLVMLSFTITGTLFNLVLFLIATPYLVLAFKNAFYRERFFGVFPFSEMATEASVIGGEGARETAPNDEEAQT